MTRIRRAIASALFCPLIALSAACDDSKSPSQSDGGAGGSAPLPEPVRLGWSQAAPSAAAVQGYSFILFVDGERRPFAGATCPGTATAAGFECSGPLPVLPSGRRVLEVSTIAAGIEGARSASLTVDVGSDGRPRALQVGDAGLQLGLAATAPIPSSVCVAGAPERCLTATVLAADLEPVRRLLPLPDGRLLTLHHDGTVTMLPSSASERPELTRSRAESGTETVDVAADPDFSRNRFLYFAVTTRQRDETRVVSVVRVREVADRMGEPAAIVVDLPMATAGTPLISVGPDRRLYVAMPRPATGATGYDGYVLRFTLDGQAAGNPRNGSPVLSRGPREPIRLAWDTAGSRLLMASAALDAVSGLAVERGSLEGPWPAVPASLTEPSAALWAASWTDWAAAAVEGLSEGLTAVAVTRREPARLSVSTLAPASLSAWSAQAWEIPLGSLIPTAVAFAGDSLLIAVVDPSNPSMASVLRMAPISKVLRSGEVRPTGEFLRKAE